MRICIYTYLYINTCIYIYVFISIGVVPGACRLPLAGGGHACRLPPPLYLSNSYLSIYIL